MKIYRDTAILAAALLFVVAFAGVPGPAARATHGATPAEGEREGKASGEADAIAKLREEWAKDLPAKKHEAMAMLYAPDAVFLTARGERITGRQAIQELCRTTMRTWTSHISLHSVVVEYSGDLAYDSGEYRESMVSAGRRKIEIAGNYLMVFKRQNDGQWLIAEQAWTEKPPAAQNSHSH